MAKSDQPVIRLFLKQRPIKDVVTIPVTAVKKILDGPDPKQRLLDFFAEVDKLPGYIHDKQWLEQLCSLPVAKDGTTPKNWASWVKLLTKVSDLDDSRTGYFTIPWAFKALIVSRLSDDNFKLPGSMSPQWAAFYIDLCQALDYTPVTDNALWEDWDAQADEPDEAGSLALAEPTQ